MPSAPAEAHFISDFRQPLIRKPPAAVAERAVYPAAAAEGLRIVSKITVWYGIAFHTLCKLRVSRLAAGHEAPALRAPESSSRMPSAATAQAFFRCGEIS